MRISECTTLQDVIRTIGWEDRSYMVDPMSKLGIDFSPLGKPRFEQLTLQQVGQFSGGLKYCGVEDGLQYLVDRCKNGQVFYPFRDDRSTGIAAFPLSERKKCVIICPGGGYTNVFSLAEGYPVAAALNRMGYAAFVVHYRTFREASVPNPMDDLAQAVRFLLEHADVLNVDMVDYAVMGFSAGGHLAASFGTQSLGYARYGHPAPKCMILGYPVITMGEHAHAVSRERLLGKQVEPELCDRYSIEKQVDSAYPRTFLWQCDADCTVPIRNSELMAQALAENGVEYAYEVFPGDAHGWGLGLGTAAEGWLDRAVRLWTK